MSLWIKTAIISLGILSSSSGPREALSNSLFIGDHAGANVMYGTCNIIIGHDEGPKTANYYISLDGKIYPNSARWDQQFQSLARQRAAQLLDEIGHRDAASLDFIDRYFAKGRCVPEQS